MKAGILIFISAMFFSCSQPVERKKQTKEPLKVVGYVAGYEDFDPSKVEATKLTHINYAFANVVNGKAQFELETDSVKIASLIALKKANPNLKVLYSIGGWTWSDQFSNVSAYKSSREKFATSSVRLMEKYGFDGIDIDWEYPGQHGRDNAFRPSDKENFTLLLKEIRKKLDVEGKKHNVHYLLTIAAGADQKYINHTDLGKAHQYLDYINVMCYDFYNGWYYQTGHHANLYTSTEEMFQKNSGEEAINRLIKTGVPSDKLVLGIPFYGRMWEKVIPINNGLYQTAMAPGVIIPYWDIVEKLKSRKYLKLYDESAKASYLWNAQDSIFISWETPKEIQLKSEFIKEKGLGGAMFWEYSLDKDQELLNKLFESMR